MMQYVALLPLACMLLLHAPDGSGLSIESDAITAVRPITPHWTPHIAANARAVVYTGGASSGGFAVVESRAEVLRRIGECK